MKLLSILYGAGLMIAGALHTGCGKESSPPPRHFEDHMNINGLRRDYIVNLPPAYYEDTSTYALVIGLHGTGGNAARFESDYGFSQKADEAGFIAVYPNGVSRPGAFRLRSWNAGTCCDYATDKNINDVGFISSLIDKLAGSYRVDRKRIYVTGMSNGGMMAYRLAAALPEKIAAIAPVSCSMVYTATSAPVRAVPILHLHSILDSIIPYNGGTNRLGYYFPPVDTVLHQWAERNGCNTIPQHIADNERFKHIRWADAKGGVMVEHYLTADGGHSWPGGKQVRPGADPPSGAINANNLIWDFFRQHTLE